MNVNEIVVQISMARVISFTIVFINDEYRFGIFETLTE